MAQFSGSALPPVLGKCDELAFRPIATRLFRVFRSATSCDEFPNHLCYRDMRQPNWSHPCDELPSPTLSYVLAVDSSSPPCLPSGEARFVAPVASPGLPGHDEAWHSKSPSTTGGVGRPKHHNIWGVTGPYSPKYRRIRFGPIVTRPFAFCANRRVILTLRNMRNYGHLQLSDNLKINRRITLQVVCQRVPSDPSGRRMNASSIPCRRAAATESLTQRGQAAKTTAPDHERHDLLAAKMPNALPDVGQYIHNAPSAQS